MKVRSFNHFRWVSRCYLAAFGTIVCMLFAFPAMSQTSEITISGKVTSAGEQLPGVTVTIKDSNRGVVTDADGNFVINAPASAKTLVFSSIGYATQEVPINNQTNINVELAEDITTLSEVVIVAYGNTTLKTSAGALQNINSKELQDIPAAQVTQKLQGKLAGVQINQGTGRPGQGMQVRIRGSASISTSSNPLYVVDGFPITGDISHINPNEIESITVLKDAASTSLYGSRAAFGVVMVTTKTAKQDQTNINVNAYTGIQSVPQRGRPDMMNGTEWAQFRKESFEELGQTVPAAFENPAQYGEGYDWYDAMLRDAQISDVSVSLTTGKDKFSTAVSADYFTQEGVLLKSDYTRFSLRANTIFKVSDHVKAGVNIAPTYGYGNSPNTDGMFFGSGGLINNALLTPPVLAYQNPDGTYPVTVTTPGITAFPTPNWVRSIKDIESKADRGRLLSNAYLEVEPISKLILKSSINLELEHAESNFFQPSTASMGFASVPSALSANMRQTKGSFYSWLSETTASYAKQVDEHNFDVLVGYSAQKLRGNSTTVSGSNFPDDRVRTINAAVVKNNSSSDIQEWSLISYLARINYNFREKYLFNASIRRDGSSRFGTDNKWGNFPAVSAAWIISEESFLSAVQTISFLKLRASYGVTGNNNIGNYTQYATVASSVNTAFGNTTASGVAVTNLGNSNLGWETTNQLDIGLDVGLVKDRIGFTYDFYEKRTTNLLFSLAVPRASGFTNFTGNVGEVKFWGHEFSLNTDNLVGKFKWSSNFNIAFSDNKVLELSGLSDKLYTGIGTARTITKVGERIGQFWGLVQEGVYTNLEDFESSPKHLNSQIGTIKFRDLNNDGFIRYGDEEGDRTIIGNPYPKFIFGLTNNFSYGNFDLAVVISGSYGNDVARLMDEGTANLDGVFNVLKEVKDRWRSESNPGEGKYGKTSGSTADDRAQFHTRFVQDGSHLTVKNITLGYTFSAEKIKIQNARLYGSIQQAFVFTNYDGANPEIGTDFNGNPPNSLQQGLDFSAYPIPRTFTIGLNFNF